KEAAPIAIIGGADGPTTIYLAAKLAPHLLGATAVAAYSYMSLVPIIQPPVIRLLTTKQDRKIRMEQLRPVSKKGTNIISHRLYDCGRIDLARLRSSYRDVNVWQLA
ncbi:Na+-transporting oxaloacetate decarboxylase beta subunit, partial [Acetomicrobium thermoterrenum DSM 13490]